MSQNVDPKAESEWRVNLRESHPNGSYIHKSIPNRRFSEIYDFHSLPVTTPKLEKVSTGDSCVFVPNGQRVEYSDYPGENVTVSFRKNSDGAMVRPPQLLFMGEGITAYTEGRDPATKTKHDREISLRLLRNDPLALWANAVMKYYNGDNSPEARTTVDATARTLGFDCKDVNGASVSPQLTPSDVHKVVSSAMRQSVPASR